MTGIFRKFFPLLLLLIIPACETAAPPLPTYPAVHFTSTPPYRLDVARVEIAQHYTPPLASPNVDHLSPVTPSSMIRTWADDRFKATGNRHVLKVVIKDASITEKSLPRTEGVQGMFTTDESTLYQGHMQVKLEIYGDDPLFPAAEISANVNNSRSISENASVNDRQQALYAISKAMIQNLNAQVERSLPQYFGLYRGE